MAACCRSCEFSLFILRNDREVFLLCQVKSIIILFMSGHSKWSTIKHQKAVEDNKRSSVFTKIAKQIHIAVKKGGSGDSSANPFLRSAVEEARSVNMPMENIKRAIDKALGVVGETMSEEVVYEAYGPFGVGILITAVTDNRNRTSGEIKNILDKHGAKLGGPGSVSYLKSIVPLPTVSPAGADRDKLNQLLALLSDIDDVLEVWSNLS